MPNWCTGDLKVRGRYKDIREFLSKEMMILGGSIFNRTYEEPIIDEKCGISIDVGKQGMWFRNAYRSYFENDIDIWIDEEEKESGNILTMNLGKLQTAWGTDTKALTVLSKQYNLDFKIYAYERGMEFNIDFEVHKGEVIKNNEIKFDDYTWECTNPEIGG